MSWHKSIFTVHDVESSGVNAFRDRIVQHATLDMLPSGEIRADVEHINPGEDVLASDGFAGASAVHGITADHLRRYGNPPAQSLRRLAQRLAGSLTARIPVVGMNLSYDLSMLHWECRRWDLPTLHDLMGGEPAPIIDIMILDKQLDPYRKGKRKLENLCEHYGVTHGGAHDAVEDGKATARVGWKIMQEFALRAQLNPGAVDVSKMGLHALHEAQKGWRREQCAGLERHFRKTNPDARVDACWPVCLDPTHERAT